MQFWPDLQLRREQDVLLPDNSVEPVYDLKGGRVAAELVKPGAPPQVVDELSWEAIVDGQEVVFVAPSQAHLFSTILKPHDVHAVGWQDENDIAEIGDTEAAWTTAKWLKPTL